MQDKGWSAAPPVIAIPGVTLNQRVSEEDTEVHVEARFTARTLSTICTSNQTQGEKPRQVDVERSVLCL